MPRHARAVLIETFPQLISAVRVAFDVRQGRVEGLLATQRV
jgi:hypothetical protein